MKKLTLLLITLIMLLSSCTQQMTDEEILTTSEELQSEPLEETTAPTAVLEETTEPTPEPTPVNLTPEQETQMALELLYNMSQEERLLKVFEFSKDNRLLALIGWEYNKGDISVEQLLQSFRSSQDNLTFNGVSQTATIFSLSYYDENMSVTTTSAYLEEKDLFEEYVNLYRDLALYKEPDGAFYDRYSAIQDTVISTYDSEKPWKYAVDEYGMNFSGVEFFDRLFIDMNPDNFIIDPTAIMFVGGCYAVARGIVEDPNKSDQQKMEEINAIFVESDLFTPFEKVGMLYFCRDLFNEVYDKDPFETVSVNGKTMDQVIEDLRVSNINELEKALVESIEIIDEFRNSGTIPDINFD